MGFLPRFAGEGALYGRYIRRTRPKSRIAVLHEDSEYGEDMFTGLRAGLGALSSRIAAVQTYRALGHRPERADCAAQGLARGHDHDLRAPDADDSGVSGDSQARVAAADLRQLGLDRPVRDGRRSAEHREEARRGRDLEPVPQGSDRPGAGQGSGRQALQAGPAALPAGRKGAGGGEPVRDGGRVHDGRRAAHAPARSRRGRASFERRRI